MSIRNVAIGSEAPEKVNVVIEIPQGTHNKYEYDEELDVIRLDRVMFSPVFYPTNYGFIPGTRSEDGDSLDVLVMISDALFPGCVVKVRPIGVLDMEDEMGIDCKIVAVADDDPRMGDIVTIDNLNKHHKEEIAHFFDIYKKLEGKPVKVNGWLPKDEAYRIIDEARKRYEAVDKI